MMAHLALAAALALLVPLAAGAQALDRFFFTPEERAELDVTRVTKKERPVPAPRSDAQADATPPQTVTFTGVVRRSDGRAMVWLNGRLAEEQEALGRLNLRGHVRGDGSISVQGREGEAAVRIKVGQSVEVNTGKVAERSQRRSRRPHPNDSRDERAGDATQTDK